MFPIISAPLEIICTFFKDEVQWFFNMVGCCKSSWGTIVHTGAVTRYDFPSDVSLRYACGKNLMMWTQTSNQNRLAFYFHWQSDENHIMRTVKEIWSDFNWSINLVNIILMFTCSLIKSVFVILFISYFPHCSVSAFATFQKNTKKT
jgi:hypothetical protein